MPNGVGCICVWMAHDEGVSRAVLPRSVNNRTVIYEFTKKPYAPCGCPSLFYQYYTISGRLVLNVLTSVAQWERETIGERTSQALQYKKCQGERVGTVAMGKCLSTDGKKLVDNTQEQQAITLAKQYRENGLSLRKIATKLAEQRYLNRLGSMYNARSIAIMVGEASNA